MVFLNKIAIRILSDKLRGREFVGLRKSLQQARMEVTPEEHASLAIFYAPIFALVGAVLGYLVSELVGIPWFYLAIPFPLLFGFGFYQIFMIYPSLVAKNRVPKIDAMLSSVSTFVYALSKGGVSVIESFRQVSRQKEYGEIGKEAAMIIRNVEYLGQSPPVAIKNVAMTTPSTKFKGFLDLLVPIVESGADVSEYFSRQSKTFYEEARVKQRSYLDSLGMLSEIYVIALGLGPMLLIVTLIMMSLSGAFYAEFLYLLIYIIIPLGTMLFAVVLSTGTATIGEEWVTGYGLKIKEVFKAESPEEEEIAKKLIGGKFDTLKRIISSPILYFRERPIAVLFVTLPLAIVYSILSCLYGGLGLLSITSTVVFALVIALAPFAFFLELKARWVGGILDSLSGFLIGLSGSIASGLTVQKSLEVVSESDLGPLTKEIEKVRSDISWGHSSLEALNKLQERTKIGTINRVSLLIKKASEAKKDISDVLDIVGSDSRTMNELRHERRTTMSTYVIIVYMSFAMFIVLAYVFAVYFLPLISMNVAWTGGAQLTAGAGPFNVDPNMLKMIFFHGALIQGFCSGIVAGQMGSGSPLAGLKHSLIMIMISYLVFTLLVL